MSSQWVKMVSGDKHEVLLHIRHCRHSPTIMNMVDAPPAADRQAENEETGPLELKCPGFSSYILVKICQYLTFKTSCIESGTVQDYTLSATDAYCMFEAAVFFEI